MCLIGFAINEHSVFPFILAANRDEFYKRHTKEAHFWPENPDVIGGGDLEKGGTWLGFNVSGELAMLTNIRELDSRSFYYSRGELVKNYLTDKKSFSTNLDQVEQFAGFNLLYGSINHLFYTSNRYESKGPINNGIHGISNGQLNSNWPKVTKIKQGLYDSKQITKQSDIEEFLLHLLLNNDKSEGRQLPNTGFDENTEKMLSPIFIESDNYGTRSSTIILVDYTGTCTFIERTYNKSSVVQKYTFSLKKV
ncbi:NRDE family protein [Evansella halocellulosilytica]|uniref:NRDE family protein n=1 Tax=Evansella halocellulosilytica TaxID=2011013 RepID=UPI000BB6AD34|nr:NRDE family protein [Evansella halocellulosilytica]